KRAEKGVKAQKKFTDNIINSLVDTIYILDPKSGKGINWNETLNKISGYNYKQMNEYPPSHFYPPEEHKLIEEVVKTTLKKGRGSVELNYIIADGTRIPFEYKLVLIKDAEGKPCICVVGRDLREQKQAEEKIKASLKEKEVLLQEVHHRVKNNMQLISSLFSLQSGHIKDRRALEILESSQNRVRSMALIHERFYQSKDMARVDFAEYAQGLTTHLFSSYGINTNVIKPHIDIKDVSLDINTAIPCSLIINELVSNSLKHAFPKNKKGEIKIAMHPLNKNKVELVVSDTGIGLPREMDFRKTDSLGLHLVNLLAEDQLHGNIKLDREKGTSFHIKFKVKR
ncbi:unnamed protein product, partial [marine sediment metagenome]